MALAGAGAMVSQAVKQYSPYSTPSSDPVTNIWHDALNNYAGSVTMNAMRGGVMKPYEVVGDAFGNALGNSIVEGMQKPDQSDAETARLARQNDAARFAAWPDQTNAETTRLANAGNPYAYYPDETNAEKARLGRYEEAAMDAEYLQQSDFIQNRRLEEFTLARGDAALTAMRDADIDAQALARSNAAARRNNPNYGHEGRGSVAPAISAFTRFMSNPSGGGMPTAQQEALELFRNMPRPSALEQFTAAAQNQYAGPVMKAWDPREDQARFDANRRTLNNIGTAAGGPVFTSLSTYASWAGTPESVREGLAEAQTGLAMSLAGLPPRGSVTQRPADNFAGRAGYADAANAMINELAPVAPQVTRALSDIADANGGQMVGLKYNLKTPDSLTRKLIDVGESNRVVNDTLRYTMSFDSADFAAGVKNAVADLQAQGYQQTAFRNTFKSGQPYIGINSTYLTPEGQMFELQFHTPESFYMKDVVNHPLYEQQRVLPDGHPQIEVLRQQMIQNSSTVPIPPGASSIKRMR